jgi:hypothetical protein
MATPDPSDFLLGRARRVSRRAAQIRQANAERRAHAAGALRRAEVARLQAHLFSQYAAHLAHESAALQAQRPRIPLDEATRARLTEDELWRRRLARRLQQRRSG